MTAVGRGQGRGRGLLKSPASKPGLLSAATNGAPTSPVTLRALVGALSLDPDELHVAAIIDAITKKCVDAESLSACVEMLLERCDGDWRCATSVVHCTVVCCKVDALKLIDGTSFRAVFMKALQSLYTKRESLRADRKLPSKWLSCVALLSQALAQMPLPDGSPMAIFINPVFELLEQCLSPDATDEEMRCAASQLLDVGSILSGQSSGARLSDLRELLRQRVANGSDTKLLLVDVIERFASNWQSSKSPPTTTTTATTAD